MKKAAFSAFACLLLVNGFAQPIADAKIDDSSITNNIIEVLPVKADVNLYPNPAKNKISLQVTGFESGMISIKIIDFSGNLYKEESRLLVDGNDEEIVLFFYLPSGIYFVLMQQKNLLVRKKLIVE
jgi:type IX secretion system substrate protein